jgi:hypothetical protein
MDYLHYGEDLKQKVIAAGLAQAEQMEGCTQEAITALRKLTINHWLPSVYVQFLHTMGSTSGGTYLYDYRYRCASLPTIQEIAKSSAAADNVPLPDDAFFFMEAEGTHFFFFRTRDTNDNPPVFYFVETVPPEQVTDTLVDFLEGLIMIYTGEVE